MRASLIIILIIGTIIIVGIFILGSTQNYQLSSGKTAVVSTPTTKKEVNIKASFTMVTDNITRSFKNSKYHNKSADVFIAKQETEGLITSDDPTIVHVKKEGITWDDFFKTLPMKLTKDCLITGDGERLCDKENGTLKLFLNEKQEKNLLDKEINEGDKALIKFTSD